MKPRKCRKFLRKRAKKPTNKCEVWKQKVKANRALTKTLRHQVRFRSGRTTLTKRGKETLKAVAGTLIRFPWMRVVVEGNSPARGRWGKRLTTGRARTSAKYLRARGVKNGMRETGKRSNLIGLKIHAAGSVRRPRGCGKGAFLF